MRFPVRAGREDAAAPLDANALEVACSRCNFRELCMTDPDKLQRLANAPSASQLLPGGPPRA